MRLIIPWAVLLMLVGPVLARESLQDKICHVEAGEVIDGYFFVLCEELVIDGRIEGNLLGASLRTTINGTVDGSIYMGGGEMAIGGQVNGDLHYVGAVLDIYPEPPSEANTTTGDNRQRSAQPVQTIDGRLLLATLSTRLHPGTHLPGGIIAVGYQLLIDAIVDGEVSFWGSALVVNGVVNDDVYATVGDPASEGTQIQTLLLPLDFDLNLINPGMVVGSDGAIIGQLAYTGPVVGQIDGEVTQPPVYRPVNTVPLPRLEEPGTINLYINEVGRDLTTLLVIGFLGLTFVPAIMRIPLPHLRTRPFSSLSIGMLAFIISFPVVLIVILLTLLLLGVLAILGLDGVVVAVGLLLGVLNLGGIGLFYFTAIFLSRVIVALAIGRFFASVLPMRMAGQRAQYVSLFLGVFFLSITSSLPLIGWVFSASALFLGLGTIMHVLMGYFQMMREPRTAEDAVTSLQRLPAPKVIPMEEGQKSVPPNRETKQPGPGMENLPPGFDIRFFDDV